MNALRWLVVALFLPLLLPAQSLEVGIDLFAKRKFGDAKAVFESILQKDEKNAEAHYRLGLILMMNQFRDEDEAVDHMDEAVDLNPASPDYQYGLGAAYGIKAQNAGVIKQAFLAPKIKGAFERAVKLNPNHVEAHIGLVQYYFRAPGIMGGDVAKAWTGADKVIELDEFRGRPLKANLLLSEKKNDEAVREINLLTSNRPGDWRSWRAAGSFFFRNQMTAEAIASLQKYTVLRPDTADSHTFLARAFAQKKDAEKAISLARKALTIDAQFAGAFEVLGQAYALKGQKKEAKEAYERLLATDLSQNQKQDIEKKIKELQ